MARLTLAEKLERAARKKAQAEQEESRLKAAQRKERTRQLIELGGLIVKAKIDHLPPSALYACFLRIADEAQDKDQVTRWEREGGRHFQAEEDARVVAVAKFPERVSAETAAALRKLGFRWNKLMQQWEGRVILADATAAVTAAGGKIDQLQQVAGP
ncbi:hypothetical protein M2352_003495 [Azospirillum fermentarium]|uniref:conjugal transfer protein TraD n=1 Tax=Azospirillum fermentarium TaxID=1233114 RepID=UPI00222752DA|nr:conjugal transfer protein TraD [Azospirillum fermentarium]MCW2247861.1 hypothetical protein [Azospirillum fermentarium]